MPETTRRGLYVPLDVNYREDPKIIEAGAEAELMYLRSLVLAKKLTDRDGHIHRAHLAGLAAGIESVELGESVPLDISGQLVASGLWVECGDGWLIAAWLKHNPSSEEVDATRNAEATRKANWRKGKRTATGDTDERDEVSHGTEGDATRSEVIVKRSESESESESEEKSLDTSAAPTVISPVDAVFFAWKESTGHHKAVLDKKRRAAITNALKHYSADDLADACRGVTLFPHNRGETNGTRYDDICLVLRDSEHIERFRDRYRGDEPRAAPRLPTNAESVRRAVASMEA